MLDIKEPTNSSGEEEKGLPELGLPSTINLLDIEGHDRYDDVFMEFRPDVILSYSVRDNVYEFVCKNRIVLRIEAISADVVRFRYSHTGRFAEDFSYSIDAVSERAEMDFKDEGERYKLKIGGTVVVLYKQGMLVQIKNANGDLVLNEPKTGGYYARSTMMKSTVEVRMTKLSGLKEEFFGLGDKSCTDLRGSKLENWCTDAFGFWEKSDPLYRAIPFYLGLTNGIGYGVFLDNTYKTHFDFVCSDPESTSFWGEGGELNYYYIAGPDLVDVATRYAKLTGTPELPPLWALGFHQCRWSYYPETRVVQIAEEFRKREIPCDAIYLDIDYMQNYRCFTWNKSHFPSPKNLTDTLRTKGFNTIVMINPGIKSDPDFALFQEGLDKKYFLTDADGEVYTGQVWPGDTVFPDFTNPKVRDWFGGLYRDLYLKDGVSGFWNDMNEPASFKVNHKTVPNTLRHDFDGHSCSHAKAHNIYGMQMSRSSVEGFRKLNPAKRPFLLTRASYSGGQRYAAIWTGDNVASWEHLVLANRQIQRLSISGFSHSGTDIGGFVDMPTGELLTRWLQLGVFHPIYRIHSMGNNEVGDSLTDSETVSQAEMTNRMDQEPWAFGAEWTPHTKSAIELRYRLLPYIYSSFRAYSQKGIPMLLPIRFFDQADERLRGAERDFLFGRDLLVSPVVVAGAGVQSIYFPKGDWYCFWTNRHYGGQQECEIETRIDQIPLFIRGGAVLPIYPVMQYTHQKQVEILELKVCFTELEYESSVYEDAGEGYDYVGSGYRSSVFRTSSVGGGFQVSQEVLGKFVPSYHSIKLCFIGLPNEPSGCLVDGRSSLFCWREGVLEVVVDKGFGGVLLS
jgi:alpha-glucosidase